MKTFFFSLTVSSVLLLAGFLAPPLGIIDNSVLASVGLLLLFTSVEKLPEVIKASRSIRIQSGASSVEITAQQEQEA